MTFAWDVIAPLMTEAGRRWEREEISSVGEHVVSATIRTLPGQALHLTRQADFDLALNSLRLRGAGR